MIEAQYVKSGEPHHLLAARRLGGVVRVVISQLVEPEHPLIQGEAQGGQFRRESACMRRFTGANESA